VVTSIDSSIEYPINPERAIPPKAVFLRKFLLSAPVFGSSISCRSEALSVFSSCLFLAISSDKIVFMMACC
jgi:hypothetical protein